MVYLSVPPQIPFFHLNGDILRLQKVLNDAFILAAPYLSKISFIRNQLVKLSSFEHIDDLLAYIDKIEKEEDSLLKQTDWRIFKSKIRQILDQEN